MRLPRFVGILGRALFSVFFLIVSVYCVLAYIPFTYQQVVAGHLFPWLSTFSRVFPFLYWIALALMALSVLPDLFMRDKRLVPLISLSTFAMAGVLFIFWSPVAHLQNNGWALAGAVIALLPIYWVAAVDGLRNWKRIEWSADIEGEEHRAFFAGVFSALLITSIYAITLFIRYSLGWVTGLEWKAWPVYLQWTLASHLLVFVLLFLVLDFVSLLSRRIGSPPKTEYLACIALGVLAFWMVAKVVAFLPLSFTGIRAGLMAFALSTAIVAVIVSMSFVAYRSDDGPVASGLELLIFPIRALRAAPWTYRICFLLMIPGLAYYLAIESSGMDWGFLGQRMAVIFIWILAFAGVYALLPPHRKLTSSPLAYGLAVLVCAGYVTLLPVQHTLLAASVGSVRGEADVVRDYSDFDVSLRLAHEILAGSSSGILATSGSGGRFYSFLTENADIPESLKVKPVPVRLVARLSPTPGPKPNIFIFVVDSLRRDYVSVYNPAVWFTPSMEAFGRESVVMQNAFTQYGGTALSEPCIWAGAQLLHQEYTRPFYPMNALEDLIQTDHYEAYISVDNVLRNILNPAFRVHQLDRGRGTMNLRLGRTLKELEARLSARGDDTRPVFAYTQSQDIHISVINREGRSVPRGWSSPGFDPAVASRLSGVDKSFGGFIAFLKKTGMYDNSIIILTADHGDDLGEGGRWGHAYYIFPEILRVPLIIHLPPSLQSQMSFDPKAVMFLTDITPSLYYLLGHRPILKNGLNGRPMFTLNAEEQTPYLRKSYLMVSSYGPVYGILQDRTTLYIADAINYRDYLFSLSGGPDGTPLPLDPTLRALYRAKIVGGILAVDRHYGFKPSNPAY